MAIQEGLLEIICIKKFDMCSEYILKGMLFFLKIIKLFKYFEN